MTAPMPIGDRLEAFRARLGIPDGPDVDDDGHELDDTDPSTPTWAQERAEQRWATFVPSRFLHVDLDWLAAEHPDAYPDIAGWATSGGSSNLILVGPVGTGKTGTALAACRPRVAAGVPALFAKTVLALDQMRPGGTEGYLQRILDVHLLVLDDVGVEKPTEWTVERLTAVLDHRWENERPTVVTTNLAPSELEAWLGARAYSRLVGCGALGVRLTGKDRRRGAV